MTSQIRFALFLPQGGFGWSDLLDRARRAEELGFHSFWVADHFFSKLRLDGDFPEALATVTALLASTTRLRVGALVFANPFRHPPVLAKQLATIDHLSGGRLEIGYGAGWMEEEFRAYGIEYPSMGARLAMLEEGVEILRRMFTEDRASYAGRYYRIDEAPCRPKPVQKPHPPITIGGRGERKLLRIVARHADRWNCPTGVKPEAFPRLVEVLARHCADAGRPLEAIDLSNQVMIGLAPTDAEAEEQWRGLRTLPQFVATGIHGSPATVVRALRERVDAGMRTFFVYPSDGGRPETLELFAREVMPAFG